VTASLINQHGAQHQHGIAGAGGGVTRRLEKRNGSWRKAAWRNGGENGMAADIGSISEIMASALGKQWRKA
jgi:hypothetical protein